MCGPPATCRRRVCLAAAVLILVAAAPASAFPFSNLVIFGDSLTDTGNVYIVSNRPVNFLLLWLAGYDPPLPREPHLPGRFSNGPVWIEYLAAELGTGPAIPSEGGGSNYAVGGARTENESGDLLNLVLDDDLDEQVSAYFGSNTPTGNELFVVEGGGNDLLSGGQTNPTIPAGNLIDYVSNLYAAGGRHFLVPNLPPLGMIPSRVGGSSQAILNQRSRDFNNTLDAGLAGLEQSLADITIYRVDFHDTFMLLLDNPAAFGLTNTTDPAFNENNRTVVPNPDEYLFWDTIHPTRVVHQVMGSMAIQAVGLPEPASLLMVLAGLGLLARRPRR